VTAKHLPDGRFRRLLKRATIDQSYILQHAESRQVLFQISEDIPARYSEMFQLSSGFDANDLFSRAGLARTKCGGDCLATNVRANLENISRAEPGEVLDEKQDIHM